MPEHDDPRAGRGVRFIVLDETTQGWTRSECLPETSRDHPGAGHPRVRSGADREVLAGVCRDSVERCRPGGDQLVERIRSPSEYAVRPVVFRKYLVEAEDAVWIADVGSRRVTRLAMRRRALAAAGSLRAVAFDLKRLEVAGTPVPVVPQLLTTPSGAADFDVASDGTLVVAA